MDNESLGPDTNSMDNESLGSDTDPLSVRVLVPDGGELEEPEQEGEEGGDEAEMEDEQAEEAEAEEAEEGDGEGEEEGETEDESEDEDEAEEVEGEDEEDERAEKIADEGTRLVHLNLDGLFLDLLGLEVDLDEVTLNLTASPGEGKLLGNLLDSVGGLLDDGLGSLLPMDGLGDGEDGDSVLSGLMPSMPSLPDLNPMERARAVASALASKIKELFGDIISMIPLEDLLKSFLEQLVQQIVNGGNGDGEQEAKAEAA